MRGAGNGKEREQVAHARAGLIGDECLAPIVQNHFEREEVGMIDETSDGQQRLLNSSTSVENSFEEQF